jgi:flagellar biosynthesis GTPase FlhF
MVESRKANLSAITERAGLIGGISDALIMPFIREPEAIYTAKLNQIIDTEIKRQKATEERIKAEAERKAREESERVERETKARELEAAKQLAQAVEIAAERDNAAKMAEEKAKQSLIESERNKEMLERAQKQAEEERRKASIERAMLEMERAELEAAKTTAKPELPEKCKVFFLTAQIKLRCDPNATKDDAENALRLMIAENHGEVLQIEKTMGE